MSSRSLATARAKRAGENTPQVSGNRPGTSINSHAAFSQPTQGYQQQNPNQRGRPPQPQPPMQQQLKQQQQQSYNQIKQSKQQSELPFSKLSISDAIGLITLRLGRVEQWVIETEHDFETKQEDSNSTFNLPDNSKIVDNSVFLGIVDRIESLEKKEPGVVNNELVATLSAEVSKMNEQLTKICDEKNKQNLIIAKHTEQLFKFEREFVETKDILKTFMIRYDSFTTDTNTKFSDYEFALSELEKNIQGTDVSEELQPEIVSYIENSDSIISVDLKNIIQQEFANTASN